MSYPNFADGSSRSSVLISNGIAETLDYSDSEVESLPGQRTGSLFESLTCRLIEEAFNALAHMRTGRWQYLTTQTRISGFEQYRHLDLLDKMVSDHRDLSAALGHGYIVTPDIVIARSPASREEVNSLEVFLDDHATASLTPFLESNRSTSLPFLHASVSCKWTIRSDRSQNTRTEALNLIRNRKGRLPHIVAVTAEPLPMRIASLALGTGDLDCVYHFALDELSLRRCARRCLALKTKRRCWVRWLTGTGCGTSATCRWTWLSDMVYLGSERGARRWWLSRRGRQYPIK